MCNVHQQRKRQLLQRADNAEVGLRSSSQQIASLTTQLQESQQVHTSSSLFARPEVAIITFFSLTINYSLCAMYINRGRDSYYRGQIMQRLGWDHLLSRLPA